MFIETGLLAGKLIASVAIVNLLFLMTRTYAAGLKQFTLFVTISLAVFRAQIVEHFFKIRIFYENRISNQCLEPFGVDIKIVHLSFTVDAVPANITVYMCKAFFTTESSRGQCFQYLLRGHNELLSLFLHFTYC